MQKEIGWSLGCSVSDICRFVHERQHFVSVASADTFILLDTIAARLRAVSLLRPTESVQSDQRGRNAPRMPSNGRIRPPVSLVSLYALNVVDCAIFCRPDAIPTSRECMNRRTRAIYRTREVLSAQLLWIFQSRLAPLRFLILRSWAEIDSRNGNHGKRQPEDKPDVAVPFLLNSATSAIGRSQQRYGEVGDRNDPP